MMKPADGRPPRLVVVCETFGGRGGLEQYAAAFVSRWVRSRGAVHVVTSRSEAQTVSESGVTVDILPRDRVSVWRTWTFNERVKRHLAGFSGPIWIAGLGQTTHQDVHRAGGGCHAVYSKLLPTWKRFGVKNRVQLRLEQLLYTRETTAIYVVNSHMVSRQIQDHYGVAPDRLRVISTPVDTACYRPAEDDAQRARLRSEIGLPEEGLVFLFAGYNPQRKGLPQLLAAWHGMPAVLAVAGAGLRGDCRRLAAHPSLEGKIFQVPSSMPFADVLRAVDAFVHPTHYDACANTVLQAMASGLPAVVSVRDGAAEFCEDGKTGWLLHDPADVKEIAARCHALAAASRGQRTCMGEHARRTVSVLTWERHLAQWEEAFHAAQARGGGRIRPGDARGTLQ